MGEEQTADDAGAVPAEWSLTTCYVLLTDSKAGNSEEFTNVNTIRGQHYWGDSRKQAWEEKQLFNKSLLLLISSAPQPLFNDCILTMTEWLYQVSQFFHNNTPEQLKYFFVSRSKNMLNTEKHHCNQKFGPCVHTQYLTVLKKQHTEADTAGTLSNEAFPWQAEVSPNEVSQTYKTLQKEHWFSPLSITGCHKISGTEMLCLRQNTLKKLGLW